MSVADVASRIQQIQGQLALLTPRSADPAAAASFATALADAGTTTDAAPAAATGPTGQAVVEEARKYLGVPYVWGGTDPQKGLDCSGLVQLVYKKFGVELPRVSYQQATAGTAVEGGLANAKPGDVLAFGSPVHHVAIYIGDNKMIEAPRPGKDVQVSPVYETPTHIRRVLTGATTSTGSATSGTGALSSATPYASLFASAGAKYGVSPTLLAAVAHQESGYNASVTSRAGAKGLMQLMPATARGLGVDPLDPKQAVDGAARMLKGLISEFGSVDKALAAYNAGPGAVHRYHGIPPYPETQRYVPAVLGYQKVLENA